MMQCIQNALDAGFLSPGEASALNQRVSDLLRQGLAPQDVKARMVEQMQFEAREAARRALIQEEKRKELTGYVLNHKNARGENDPAEALWLLVGRQDRSANFTDIESLQYVIAYRVQSDLDAALHEFRKRYWTGDTNRLRQKFAPRLHNVLIEVMEAQVSRDTDDVFLATTNKSGDPTARAHAQSWIRVTEYLRKRFNAAGGSIGKLDYAYMPQSHDGSALANAGGDPARARSYWVDYMMQPGVLDRKRMVSNQTGELLSDEDLREALGKTWERITSDGWIDREPSFSPLGKQALAKQRAEERFIHFKNAEAWQAYHREFGKGDVYDAMVHHIDLMSRDIATLEVFGPNPTAMRNYLKQLVLKQAAIAKPSATVIGEETLNLQRLLDGVRGNSQKNQEVIGEVRKVLNNLEELHRKIGAGGSRKRHLEEQAARQVGQLTELRETIRNLGLRGLSEQEASVSRRLSQATGELRQLQETPDKGVRGRRRRAARIAAFQKDIKRLRAELDDMRRTHGTAAQRVDAIERNLFDAETELNARQDRNFAQPSTTRTRELKTFIERSRQQLDQMRPTIASANPQVRDDMIAVIDRLENGIEGITTSVTRDLEPVEQLVNRLVDRLGRFEVEAGDRLVVNSAQIERALNRLGRGDVRPGGEPFDVFLGIFRGLANEVRRRRLGADPELRRDLENQLREAEENFGAVLDDIGVGRAELEEALRLTQASRPLFETPRGFRSVKDPFSAARKAIDWHDRMWDVARGNADVPASKTLANIGRTLRNITVAAKLGAAVVAALGDVPLQRRVWRLTGMPMNTLRIAGGVINAMRDVNQREATRSMLGLDSAMHVAHQRGRYSDDFETRSWSGYFADRVINVQGLAAWTQAAKHFFGMSFQGELADRVNLPWQRLDPQTRRMFNRHGLDEAEWDLMRQAELHEPDKGVTYLRPNEIFKLPGGEEVGERYLAMILRLTAQAVPESTVRSRAAFHSGQAGTWPGELMRFIGQFKTFPLQVYFLHIGEIHREFQAGNHKAGRGQARSLFVTLALMGLLINELIELKEFRQPILPTLLAKGQIPALDYWIKAVLKGGGLGIYGDLAFSGADRVGGFAAAIAGPVIGLTDRARSRTYAELTADDDKSRLGRRVVQVLKEVTPGANLWFSKGITDRLVFAQLQHMFDGHADAFFRRKEQMQQRKVGNKYFWGPGDTSPDADVPIFGGGGRRVPAAKSRSLKEERASLLETLREVMGSDKDANALARDIERRGLLAN